MSADVSQSVAPVVHALTSSVAVAAYILVASTGIAVALVSYIGPRFWRFFWTFLYDYRDN